RKLPETKAGGSATGAHAAGSIAYPNWARREAVDLQRALANQPVNAESVMTDAERTQFIARTPPPPVAIHRRDTDEPMVQDHRRTGLLWLAVVLAMLLVVAGVGALVYFTRKQDDNAPKTVSIPAIIGLSANDAAAKLRQDGFTNTSLGPSIADVSQCASVVKENTVCTVSPIVGDPTKTNVKVTYSLYTIAKTTVPSVIGLSYNDAAAKINQAHLIPVPKDVDVPGNCQQAGCVTDQNPLPYGAPIAQNSKVTLSVWSGKVKLPNVQGKKVAEAKTILNNAQFTDTPTQTKITPNPAQNGLVADESPTPGIAYPVSTTIHLTIYKYQRPEPTCTTVQPTTTTPTTPPGAPTTNTSSPPPDTGSSSTTLPPCTTS
ncbi:MAG: PASTA domain-containing protein, partial [Mycobacterium sp.]